MIAEALGIRLATALIPPIKPKMVSLHSRS